MNIRRLFAIFSLILVGGVLVACGNDDDDAEPTTTVAATEVVEADGEEPTVAETEEADDSAAHATPAMTPVSGLGTPVSGEDATPGAGLGVVTAEPVEATPVATPDATPVATPDNVASPVTDEASPVSGEADTADIAMVPLEGTITLEGRAQQDFSFSDNGCVGLGQWQQLKPGSQVIVRDANGTVVSISELEGQASDDTCWWSFAIEVPGADFFSVSIPMVTEVWFDQNDPAVQSGELELTSP